MIMNTKTQLVVLFAMFFSMIGHNCNTTYCQSKPVVYLQGVPQKIHPDDVFEVEIMVEGEGELMSVQLLLFFDSDVLEMNTLDDGTIGVDTSDGISCERVLYNRGVQLSSIGSVKYLCLNIIDPVSSPSPWRIGTLTFRAIDEGTSILGFQNSIDKNTSNNSIIYEKGTEIVASELETVDYTINSAQTEPRDYTPPEVKIFPPDPLTINPLSQDVNIRKTEIKYSLSENAYVTAWIEDKDFPGTEIRRLSDAENIDDVHVNSMKQLEWDGKDNDGTVVSDTGEYYLVISARDYNLNETEVIGPDIIKIDSTPPEITLELSDIKIFSPNSDMFRDNMKFQYSIDEDAVSSLYVHDSRGIKKRDFLYGDIEGEKTLNLEWDGKDNSGEYVSDGKYSIIARATDSIGLFATQEISGIIIDTTPPVLSDEKPNSDTLDTSPEISFKVSDSTDMCYLGYCDTTVLLDDYLEIAPSAVNNSIISFQIEEDLEIGPHYVEAEYNDFAGNKSELEWLFTVIPAPDIEFVYVFNRIFNPINDNVEFHLRNNWVYDVSVKSYVYAIGTSENELVSTEDSIVINVGQEGTVTWDGKWNLDGKDQQAHDGSYRCEFVVMDEYDTEKYTELEHVVYVDMTAPYIDFASFAP